MKKFLLFILILILLQDLYSQTENVKIIQDLIEEIAESSEEELDYSTLFDDLNYFVENPLNLNTATREDLEKIQFLTDLQIEGILNYRKKSGTIVTIYEMQVFDGFSSKDVKQLLPFVTVDNTTKTKPQKLGKALKYGRNSLFLRTQFITQKEMAYKEDKYLGNKLKYYAKYQFNYKKKIQFGFVAEKDPGEEFFKGTQKQGFDYYSAHIQLNDVWKFKNINIGDFQAKFGQGLISWTGMSSKKSAYVMNIRKKNDGIRKYSSTDENKFLRGVGGTARFGKFDLTGFVSYKNIDGNAIPTDTLSDEQIVSSFQTTGMHRTDNEIADRKIVSEFIYGGNLKWSPKSFKIGASFLQYFFGSELSKEIEPHNKFYFQGKDNLNASIDYQFNIQNFYFFGEEAISKNGGYATLNGMLLKLAPQISLSALHRNYTRDYQAYYAGGFGEQSKTINENGLYLGTEIHPYRDWTISAYFDAYKLPWLSFKADAPSRGLDFFTEINYNLSRNVQMYIRYKNEEKYQNSAIDVTGVDPIISTRKKQFRYHLTYKLSKNLTLKNRIEFARYYSDKEASPEKGFILYQDINYKLQQIPLSLNFRFGIFDTDYNARIYAYENDILYGFSIPGYSGSGTRTYLTLKYTVFKQSENSNSLINAVDIWLRYANYKYSDRDIVGSGLNEIEGNSKSEVKFQVRFKF